MVRLKGNCPECGKLVANAKLISPPHSDKKLCNGCRKKEMKKYNKTFMPKIDNLPQKIKEVLKISKRRNDYLSKDEVVFLKNKYHHNPLISGTSRCSPIINLKNKLRECGNRLKKKKFEEEGKIEEKKKINEDFLSGLK